MKFYSNPETLSIKLNEGITHLLQEVGGNKILVKKVIDDFIEKTPEHIKQLAGFVQHNEVDGLKERLHLLKVRYGYLGLQNIMNEMEAWEQNAHVYESNENRKIFERFESTNITIAKKLKEIDIHGISEYAIPTRGTVLIIDDDEINTLILKENLANFGYSVSYSANGYMATQLVQHNTFDFVFVDIHMPFFSGVEAIKKIREVDSNIFIVAISASKDAAEIEQCFKEGANKFLAKPVRAEFLGELLAELSVH
jgi:CheY-like chemotaxis protein